ncbi:SLATT domain-containing protein [Pseudomonas donghuensis]|uniref:SLATT domain-containing protein n=1 Tax=Pseudomonas donghuensis TaxID=1163398 RepID=UPI0039E1D578|nr:SLATT domain-containing protein [Pseudomonas donghuensis]
MSNSYQPPKNPIELLSRWNKRARESQFCHYYVAKKLHGKNVALGIAIILITTINGLTSIFSTPPKEFTIALGFLSLVATFLTSLQTFFKYEERSISHRNAGAKYGSARRYMEQLLSSNAEPSSQDTDTARKMLDGLAEASPSVSKSELQKSLNSES